MRRSQGLTWSQVALAANAPMLTRATMVDGHLEVGILPTGQGVGVIDDLPTCAEVVERTVNEATEVLDRLLENCSARSWTLTPQPNKQLSAKKFGDG